MDKVSLIIDTDANNELDDQHALAEVEAQAEISMSQSHRSADNQPSH